MRPSLAAAVQGYGRNYWPGARRTSTSGNFASITRNATAPSGSACRGRVPLDQCRLQAPEHPGGQAGREQELRR
jgi:hypothetical protein